MQFFGALVVFAMVWITFNPQFTLFADAFSRNWGACIDWVIGTVEGTHFSSNRPKCKSLPAWPTGI